MSVRYQFNDHVMMIANYKTPDYHAHLASHIIISLGDAMRWRIEGEEVVAKGICIGPNVGHAAMMPEEGAILFLFTETSRYAASIKKNFLKERAFTKIEDEVVDKILVLYNENKEVRLLDRLVLSACSIEEEKSSHYEPRIKKVIEYVEQSSTITKNIYEELSSLVCLSKSRLSHLFREQTGMTLHSYLAFEKLRKTDFYIRQGESITEACMRAGFDSPSHCASSAKRMLGVSFHDVYKTMKVSV